MNLRLFAVLTAASASFFLPLAASASFGITPPYVKNDSLTRGSEYTQTIILVRGDPVEDLQARITTDVPGATDWFSVDKGNEFTLPKGAQQVPINVRVKVPAEAKFGEYKGNIRVVIFPPGNPAAGTVGITLGAQIDVDLNVIDKQIADFKIRTVKLDDVQEGHKWWWLFFPGKIKFDMQLENVGNVETSPSKVVFDIYDPSRAALRETTEHTNGLKKVKPFAIETVTAELPTRLPAGVYSAVYKIYRGDEIVQRGELPLSILPFGQLMASQGYGFDGLPLRDQTILSGGGLALLAVVGLAVRRGTRAARRRRVPLPPRA